MTSMDPDNGSLLLQANHGVFQSFLESHVSKITAFSLSTFLALVSLIFFLKYHLDYLWALGQESLLAN